MTSETPKNRTISQGSTIQRSLLLQIENIYVALNLVTDLVDDKQLSESIRISALDGLIQAEAIVSSTFFIEKKAYMPILQSMYTTRRLFRVAYRSGFISKGNFSIIDEKIDTLIDSILNKRSEYEISEVFEVKERVIQTENKTEDYSREHAKVLTPNTDIHDENKEKSSEIPPKETPQITENKQDKTEPQKEDLTSFIIDPAVIEREELIMSLMREKGLIQLHQIADHIPGVSTKTIQRSLQSLVERNVIEKRGSRRWATYHMSK